MPTQPNQRTTRVRLTTLDSLCEQQMLNRIDTIKIDVEGYEVEVFRGAARTLARFRPLVYGEFNNQLMPLQGSSFLDAWSIFEPLGYRCFSFRDRLDLVEQPRPAASLGNAVLCPAERVPGLVNRGVRIDST